MNLDFYLFHAINGLAGKSKILDWLGIFLGDYLAYLLVLAALYFFIQEKNWQKKIYFFSLTALSVILSRGILTETIRFIWARQRPFAALGLQSLIGENPGDSLPSGHASAFFALGFAIFYFFKNGSKDYRKNPGTWFLVAALIMGLARVFAGIHWPSDILLGALIGWGSAFLIEKLLNFRERTGEYARS